MSRLFGWSYPPGCSSPPEDDCTCEVCGGDAENMGAPGGCICDYLFTKDEAKAFGGEVPTADKLTDAQLNKLQERFSLAAGNLLLEIRRRYERSPAVCPACKKPVSFDEMRREQCHYHSECWPKDDYL